MQIIGVYKAEGGFMEIGDSEALIQLSLWPTLYGTEEINNISVQAKNVDDLEPVYSLVNMLGCMQK